MTTVYYHNHCIDGMFAAVQFINSGYDIKPFGQKKIAKNDLIFADCAPSYEDAVTWAQDRKVTIIDHHITNFQKFENKPIPKNLKLIFDMNESGASLVFKYLNPGVELPYHLELVRDRDLWLNQYPDTKNFYARLRLEETLEDFDSVPWRDLDELKAYIKEGELLRRYEETLVRKIISSQNLKHLNLNDMKIPAVNSNCNFSEIGHELLQQTNADVAAVYQWIDTENIVVSLRSREKDISGLCVQMGGGGHPRAGGFKLRITEFIKLLE